MKEKTLNDTHTRLLHYLRKYKHITLRHLTSLMHQSPSGITSRISELRKLGYNIQLSPHPTNKYTLIPKPHKPHKPTHKPKSTADNILTWISTNNLYNTPIHYDIISKQLNLPKEEIITAMISLFKKVHLTQMNNNEVIIHKPY